MRPRVDSTVAAIVLGSGDGGQLSCELSVFWRQELPAEGRLFRFRSGRWCGDLPRSGKTFSSAMPSGLQFFLLLMIPYTSGVLGFNSSCWAMITSTNVSPRPS